MSQPFMTVPASELKGDQELKEVLQKAQENAYANYKDPDPLVETAEQKAAEPQRICPLCQGAVLTGWYFCPNCGGHTNLLTKHEFPVNVMDVLIKGFCEAEFEVVKGLLKVRLRSMTVQDHDYFLEWLRVMDKPIAPLQMNSKLRAARVAACIVTWNGQPFVDKVLTVSDQIPEEVYVASLSARFKKLLTQSDTIIDRILALHTEFCHHVDRKLSDPNLVGNS